MRRDLSRLTRAEFDVLIVGGGITGACLAHDAALRGLSVALVERQDFGGATSAASSKLLHGGVRYLQTLQLGKVRESAVERACFQRIAPHLIRWVPFLIPTYRGVRKGRALLAAGIAAYELVCRGHDTNVPPSLRAPRGRYLSPGEIAREMPALLGSGTLTGAQLLFEAHMHSSERMTLAFLRTADREGAAIANYAMVEDFVLAGSAVRGAVVRDVPSSECFEVHARLTVNAAGPWIPSVNQRLAVGRLPRPITHFSKGAHIVTRQIAPRFAVALPSARQGASLVSRGGRHIFAIPWRGHSLIGTSDSPFQEDLDAVGPSDQDIDDLLEDVAAVLPDARLGRGDVRHAFAGLYPLTGEAVRPHVYRGTGTYQVVDHAGRDGVDGFVSVVGAKYTTARRLAAGAIDVVMRKLGRARVPCRTAAFPLVGFVPDPEAYTATLVREHEGRRVEAATVAHLVAGYGSEAGDLLRGVPQSLARLTLWRESIEAEVTFAVREEMAVRLEDVVFRRTGLGTLGHPGLECLRRCAEIMAGELGWTDDETRRQVEAADARFPIRPTDAERPSPAPAPAPGESARLGTAESTG